MARRPGTWDIHVSHHSAAGGAAWLGGDALGRTKGESWIRQRLGFCQPERRQACSCCLLEGAAQRPAQAQATWTDRGGQWRGKRETGVHLQLGGGGCPTSTTDLLGDLGQLASPAWASVSSSVN